MYCDRIFIILKNALITTVMIGNDYNSFQSAVCLLYSPKNDNIIMILCEKHFNYQTENAGLWIKHFVLHFSKSTRHYICKGECGNLWGDTLVKYIIEEYTLLRKYTAIDLKGSELDSRYRLCSSFISFPVTTGLIEHIYQVSCIPRCIPQRKGVTSLQHLPPLCP